MKDNLVNSIFKHNKYIEHNNNSNSTFSDYGLIVLSYEQLPNYKYTLEEVKKLSAATKNAYKLGVLDGENVAIIGIPNYDMFIDKVRFGSEGLTTRAHNFQIMTDEDAVGRNFVVYPYIMNCLTDSVLKKTIHDIRNSYADDVFKNNYSELEQEKCLSQSEDIAIENLEAMKKKVLYYKKK